MADFSQPVILTPQPREKNPRAIPPGSFSRAGGIRMTAAWISRIPLRLVSLLIWIYQKTISPALVAIDPTGGCRFAPSCSHYARGALEEHGLIVGTGLTICRLAKCGPWHPGGEDPVPARRKPTCTAVRPAPSPIPHHSSLS